MGKKKSATTANEISFEESIRQIQEIVQALEEGSLEIDESLKQFEKGIQLIRMCHQKLEQAEQQIKILTDIDADGNPILSNFDASSTLQANQTSAGRRKTSEPPSDKAGPAEGPSLF